MKKFSHLDAEGTAKMVDVSAKPDVTRRAVARGEIRLQAATLAALEENRVAKGNVLATARVAGIMAAKKTGELIPLCHPLASPMAYLLREVLHSGSDHLVAAPLPPLVFGSEL